MSNETPLQKFYRILLRGEEVPYAVVNASDWWDALGNPSTSHPDREPCVMACSIALANCSTPYAVACCLCCKKPMCLNHEVGRMWTRFNEVLDDIAEAYRP